MVLKMNAQRAGRTLRLVLAVCSPAVAQVPTAPASAGRTDVAKEGFQAVGERVVPDASKDASNLKLTLGGFLSRGNSRTIAVTGAVDYFLRRDASAFTAAGAVNYGSSAPGVDQPYQTTVENYQARVRYDYFFANSVAGFVSVSARRDRFQGLNLRLNIDPGVAYYFIDEKSHRLWAELGYDLQYDLRNQGFIDDAVLAAAPAVITIDDTEVRHNVRVFVGYDNQLTNALGFAAGVEYLQNVTEAENARINIDTGLTAQVNSDFSVATTISVKYDKNPLPGVEDTDLISALNLVYTMK